MGGSSPLDLAADIVKAFVSNNSLPIGELPALFQAAGHPQLTGRLTRCSFQRPRGAEHRRKLPIRVATIRPIAP
jgi:predicted transcriptional regulator